MSIGVQIKKDFGNFRLDVAFASTSRRIGILGASGCGKSMTLKSIAGIEQPDAGRIAADGRLIFDTGAGVCLKPQQRGVGYLFQNYALFPAMTVEQNVAAGLRGKKAERRIRTGQMIAQFRLQGLEKRFPWQLSGGQQQRVALARMFACEPQMVLLDEPFSALDLYLRDEMQRELLELFNSYSGTVVLVSHNRDEVYRMSEELLVMDGGRIVRQGRTGEVFENPQNIVTARLTGCKNIARASLRPQEGLYAAQWGVCFPFTRRIDGGVCAVAIRAHAFRMKQEEGGASLCFPLLDPTVTEDLFEYHVSFRPSPDASQRMDWKVSKYVWDGRREKMPDRLYVNEADVLLLRQ